MVPFRRGVPWIMDHHIFLEYRSGKPLKALPYSAHTRAGINGSFISLLHDTERIPVGVLQHDKVRVRRVNRRL